MPISRRQLLKQSLIFAGASALPAFAQTQATLNQKINNAVKIMRQQGRITQDERTAWYVSDLKSGRTLASINSERPLQSASMVKPLVIQAYLYCHHQKSKSIYPLDTRIKREMEAMIVKSNNQFTNHIFRRLGGPQGVQWMLRKEAPNIFRHIQIVEEIPNGGRTYKNLASASDYDRFLRALWQEQLPGAAFLKQLMQIKNPDRIRSKSMPTQIEIYDKTGSTARLCGNFGIIAYRRRNNTLNPYTFTAIIEKKQSAKNYSQWIRTRGNCMREISELIYRHIQQQIP